LNLLDLQVNVNEDENRWLLIICQCGNHFGSFHGKKAICNMCGESNNLKTKKSFSDSNKLAEAVSEANIPTEILTEIEKRMSEEEKIKNNFYKSENRVEKIHSVLKKSTDEDGIMKKEKISQNLSNQGIESPTFDQIMGMAEEQGIVIRCSIDSWRWV
tara:strand:- start:125152 stop:125625 length:474 start_codon:yes stop_codon:yes gene_type:complete